MVTIDQINKMLQDVVEDWRLIEEAVGKQTIIDLENLLCRRSTRRWKTSAQ